MRVEIWEEQRWLGDVPGSSFLGERRGWEKAENRDGHSGCVWWKGCEQRAHYRRCSMWGHGFWTQLVQAAAAAASGSPIAHRWRLCSRNAW